MSGALAKRDRTRCYTMESLEQNSEREARRAYEERTRFYACELRAVVRECRYR
jgi:hypothetical protein